MTCPCALDMVVALAVLEKHFVLMVSEGFSSLDGGVIPDKLCFLHSPMARAGNAEADEWMGMWGTG